MSVTVPGKPSFEVRPAFSGQDHPSRSPGFPSPENPSSKHVGLPRGSMSKLGRCSDRHGESWDLVVVGSHGRIPSGEQVAQRAIESFGSGLQEPVGPLLRPLHLLFLGEASADHEVDGGLSERGGDPLAVEPAFAVVRESCGIVGDVGGQVGGRLDQPLQLGIATVQGGNIRGELLGPGQRLAGVAVPEPPFDPLQAALQRSSLDGVVVRQAFGVLAEPVRRMAMWNQSRIGAAPGAITPASARTLSPPSVNIVTVWVPGRSCRTARSRWSDCSSWLATRPKYRSLRPVAMDLPTMTSKLRFLSDQFRTYPPSMPTMTVPCGSGWSLPVSRPPCCSPPRSAS